MKIVLAGAFGHLGYEILKQLVAEGHDVVAADLTETVNNECVGKYLFKEIDALKASSFDGLCDGADLVISTMGLTGAAKLINNYDVDYRGNMYLYRDACRHGVKSFHYVSVIDCDAYRADEVPMLDAKYMFEERLKSGRMNWVIYRPTGYFYDICKVFKPYVDNGCAHLLKGYHQVKANVVACEDLASFIIGHLYDSHETYCVGGKETYTYEQMIHMCFRAAGKRTVIKDSPTWLFDVLACLPMIQNAGRRDIVLFSKWTLTHDLVGDTVAGNRSFAQYVKEYFGK